LGFRDAHLDKFPFARVTLNFGSAGIELREVPAVGQMQVEIHYKGYTFLEPLKLDFYIDDCLLVELKAVETVLPIHKGATLQLYETPRCADRITH
jgi:GxxExxY protein